MTNKDLTQIKVIVDRSGSMFSVAKDMIAGLNALFAGQGKLDGECVVDYSQFDTEYDNVFSDVPASEAKAVLQPRGGTALLDAIGKGVVELGEKLAAKDEADRPGTVMVVIVTDGMENASREWTKAKVKELVERQQDEWNWDFVFLGANMDAVGEGASMGFKSDKSMTYDTTNSGLTMGTLNTYTTNFRSSGAAAFTDEDRKNAVQK